MAEILTVYIIGAAFTAALLYWTSKRRKGG